MTTPVAPVTPVTPISEFTDADELRGLVVRLHSWFETMRGDDGYTGPVTHWWMNTPGYTGVGIDWRYEGIIAGYLNLYALTGEGYWLDTAVRAADDIVRAQLPDGHYHSSGFEQNPYAAGTPGEFACDVGLLLLARTLRDAGDVRWQQYLAVAGRNLTRYALAQLWDAHSATFRDQVGVAGFVPNKAATLCEALLLLADLTHDDRLLAQYVLPTLDAIVAHQVPAPSDSPLAGAIAQASAHGRPAGVYFPYYVARCIPALVQGYTASGNARYLHAAQQAGYWLGRVRLPDGSMPQVLYANGKCNLYPQWTAGVGDVLRAWLSLQPHGVALDLEASFVWLVTGKQAMGAFRTAWGFAAQVTGLLPQVPADVRDMLPCCGWNDKALRLLTELLLHLGGDPVARAPLLPAVQAYQPLTYTHECRCGGRIFDYYEDSQQIHIARRDTVYYQWWKGAVAPVVLRPPFIFG